MMMTDGLGVEGIIFCIVVNLDNGPLDDRRWAINSYEYANVCEFNYFITMNYDAINSIMNAEQ